MPFPSTANSAVTFTTPQICVAMSPVFTPIQCIAVKRSTTPIAIAVSPETSDGAIPPTSSPSAIATAAMEAALESQSVQPMTKPAYSPSARRA
jgi:hypothetical protein